MEENDEFRDVEVLFIVAERDIANAPMDDNNASARSKTFPLNTLERDALWGVDGTVCLYSWPKSSALGCHRHLYLADPGISRIVAWRIVGGRVADIASVSKEVCPWGSHDKMVGLFYADLNRP